MSTRSCVLIRRRSVCSRNRSHRSPKAMASTKTSPAIPPGGGSSRPGPSPHARMPQQSRERFIAFHSCESRARPSAYVRSQEVRGVVMVSGGGLSARRDRQDPLRYQRRSSSSLGQSRAPCLKCQNVYPATGRFTTCFAAAVGVCCGHLPAQATIEVGGPSKATVNAITARLGNSE